MGRSAIRLWGEKLSTRIKPKAMLVLENGLSFEGSSFGADGESIGEIVFNTSMTGYQEVLTDPSYKGQIVLMTYPHIGNTGINIWDDESDRIHLEALIVKEYCPHPSSWRSSQSLESFLLEFHIPAIEGIDTRYLTRTLRMEGALRAIISTTDFNKNSLLEKVKQSPQMIGQNLVKQVSTKEIYEFSEKPFIAKFHVVAFDLGIKRSIFKALVKEQCRVTVVPYDCRAEDILRLNPDGIFLSNGPGDPAAVTQTIETTKQLLGKKPMMGICLGHQILGLALGGTTSKLKFGHHGANHPVLNKKTNVVEITSQNHGFVVDLPSLPKSVELTHLNLNDHTVEGIADRKHNFFSVQYHPEASPGPHDSTYLFEQFRDMMENHG